MEIHLFGLRPMRRSLVNEDWVSGRIGFVEAPTRYVRLLPHSWNRDAFDAPHSILLGHTTGYSAGQARGGLLTYTGSLRGTQEHDHVQATMWFMDTGEVWAFDRFIVAEYRGQRVVFGDDLIKSWISFLVPQLRMLSSNGGSLPVRVKLGFTGLSESFWPVQNPVFSSPEALEERMEHEFVISTERPEDWLPELEEAWRQYRAIYSMPRPQEDEVRAMRRSIPVLRSDSQVTV